ncbi:hypothetical protein ACILE2_01550 [Capnocytophaga canimorsus]|uniref:hypothetical protein n=1 Tax=Capnocytophaga canimorsus TaxID=28188 RepID=UPI0037D2833A
MNFRKHIIKFFALDYKVFIFGRLVSFTRSANVIFPLVVLCGYLNLSDKTCLVPTIFAYCLLAIALFFGFVYFRLKPLKQVDYDYFDQVQKFIWKNKQVAQPKRWNGSWVFWVNPLVIILFLIIYLLCN